MLGLLECRRGPCFSVPSAYPFARYLTGRLLRNRTSDIKNRLRSAESHTPFLSKMVYHNFYEPNQYRHR